MIPVNKPTEGSLLERIGGVGTIRRVVDIFYDSMMEDEKLKPLFEGIKMSALKVHQLRFFRLAFSGVLPDDIMDTILDRHQPLFEKGLSEEHFDVVMTHLDESLTKIKMKEELRNETVAVVSPLRAAFAEGARIAAGGVPNPEFRSAKKEKKITVRRQKNPTAA